MSILKLNNDKMEEYEWLFNIPPKSRIVNNLMVMKNPNYCFKNLKFTTGMLSKHEHSWEFKIDCNLKMHISLSIDRHSDFGFHVGACVVHTLKGDMLIGGAGFYLKNSNNYHFDDDCKLFLKEQVTGIPEKDYWWSHDLTIPKEKWNDSVDALKVIMYIQYEEAGQCINLPKVPMVSKGPRTEELIWKQYFMSEFLSDVTIETKDGKKFPAHKMTLCSQSPVFHRMFQNVMKETKEGLIKIDDIDPEVMKETLYYIYTGDVKEEVLNVMSVDLLRSADKYELEDLKSKCSNQIASSITYENAVEIYILGDTYNAPGLRQVAKDIIKRNKIQALKDSNSVLELANRCPKLAFELMTM